ncbi:MAG: M48 family metalloprotease [Planctomycetes bacterium]|nr:M48 family metalloprotease [Planctomycetota bacterium]
MRSLESPVVQSLGWALLHFLWQGTMLAAGLAVMLFATQHASPQRRYLVLCAGLVAITFCPIATWIWIASSDNRLTSDVATLASTALPDNSPVSEAPDLGPYVVTPAALDVEFAPLIVAPGPVASEVENRTDGVSGSPTTATLSDQIEQLLPWLVTSWFVCVLVLSIRLLAVWRIVQSMKHRAVKPVADEWQRRLNGLAARLRVSRPVQLLESALVDVPTVIGWLKPIILIPASSLTGLTVPQLEAVLAHELAHIRRHDYLVNLLQAVVETLLFYHPAVWWLSGRIRDEREHCCDDLAVGACGSSFTFAQALAAMELLRSHNSGQALVLAASGGSLITRIRRLTVRSVPDTRQSSWWGASLITLTIVTMLGVATLTSVLSGQGHEPPQPSSNVQQDATPKGETSGGSATPATDPWKQKVSLAADKMPLKLALQKVAEAANLELQIDFEALRLTELNLDEPVTLTVNQAPLAGAVSQLIDWSTHPEVLREVRRGKLVLTTLTARQARTAALMPEWMKPLHNQGLSVNYDENDQIDSLYLGSKVTDEILAQVATLKHLREIHIEVTKGLTAAGVGHFGQLPRLQKLSLFSVNTEGAGLGDDAIRGVISSTSLRELSITECGTTDAGAMLLEKLPQLTSLSLRQEGLLTDEALKSIGKLSNLKSLSLESYVGTERFGWMRFSAAGIRQLSSLTELQHLSLVGQEVSAESFSFPRLISLSLGHPSVDNAVAAKIGQLSQLRSLELTYCKVDDEGMKFIASLPELRRLDISSLTITDAAIEQFRTHKHLEHLSLRASGLSDAALNHISQIESLTRLDLSGSGHPGVSPGQNFSIAGLQQLQKLKLLDTLWLNNCEIPGGGYQALKVLKQLRELTMMMCNITDAELDALEEALPNTRISHMTGGGGRMPKQFRQPKRTTTSVEPNKEEGTATFVGIQDHGKSVVFVVDASGSMKSNNAMQFARDAVSSSLQLMNDQQQFLVIFYDEQLRVIKLNEAPQPAMDQSTDQNKELARQKFADIKPGSGTNHLPPLELALRMKPDVIFFLTDASDPPLWPQDLGRIRSLNAGRSRIHCVEIGAGAAVPVGADSGNFMRRLAVQNGGEYRYHQLTSHQQSAAVAKLPTGMVQRLGVAGSGDSIHSAEVSSVRFADNQTLVTASHGDARVWNIRTGVQEQILAHPNKATNIKGLATSPDGLLVVTSAFDNTLGIWNRKTGQRLATLPGHGERGGIRIVRFLPGGTQFASWGDDAVVRWGSAKDGRVSASINLDLPGYVANEAQRPPFGYETSQAFSPDAKSLFVVLGGQLFEYDTGTGKRLRQAPLPKSTMPLAVSADGKWIATGETRRDDNGNVISSSVILRDRATLQSVREWPVSDPHAGDAAVPQKSQIGPNDNSLVFSPDSRFLAWSRIGPRNAIDIVEVNFDWLDASIPLESPCWSLDFSPNGTYLASGHSDSTAIVWNRWHPVFVVRQVPHNGRWVPANRTVRIQVVDGHDNKPIEGVVIEAERWEGIRQHAVDAVGTTDASGMVEFHGLDAVMYHWKLAATKPIPNIGVSRNSSPNEDNVILKLPRACELTLRAVDADTGRGIPGVLFGRERALAEYWLQDIVPDTLTMVRQPAGKAPPQAQSVRTDATGTFRCLVDAATWSYSVAEFPDGYNSVIPINGSQELEIKTPSGGRVEYTFKLRKKAPNNTLNKPE